MLVAAALVVASVAAAGALAAGAAAPGDDRDDDTRENARPVEMNSTAEGTIDGPDDADWYAVEVRDLRRLLVGLDAAEQERDGSAREVKHLSLTLYGPDGEQLDDSMTELRSYSHSTAGVNHAVEAGDTYYVRVASEYDEPADNPDAEEATGPRDYELEVESVALDTNEPNDYEPRYHLDDFDDPSNTTDLALGETVSANVVGLESDTYAVELQEGDTVRVTYDVTAQVNHDGFAMPTKTAVVNPSGERVAASEADTEKPGDATYTFTAEESGTYYVAATGRTDSYAIRGIRGNDLTQYDLRVDLVCET